MKELRDNYVKATSMRAIGITAFPEIGKVADRLEMLDVPVPRPDKNDVVIKLAASALHIDEIYAAQGTALGRFYGPRKLSRLTPRILGSSASGVVVDVGESVEEIAIGDHVIAIPNEQMELGSWATYRCIDQKWVMAKDPALSHVDAAAVTMASCVAWSAVSFANIKEGSHCAIVGASGGIGSVALQYVKALGSHATAVCSEASTSLVRHLGADEVVDYKMEDFADAAVGKNQQYDAVIDCVGGRDVEQSAFRSLKDSGVFVTVVGPTKYIGEKKLSWWAFLKVLAHISWRMVSTRMTAGPRYTFSAKYPRLVIGHAMNCVLKHGIRMPLSQTVRFDVTEIADAVRHLQTHRSQGRIVIDFSL